MLYVGTYQDAAAMLADVLEAARRSCSRAKNSGIRGSLSSEGLNIEGDGELGGFADS